MDRDKRLIHIDGPWFKDEHGRTLILRGINLGGSSKVPTIPDGASHLRDGFFDHRQVSFIGRPFPLDEADQHFARLKKWGLTFLRFLVTWEAIEHTGPGIYDEAYLDYLYEVIKKAADYGINIFIDPHQDCWSRFSGGDGAPGWTLEAVGMDITRISETGAGIVHNVLDAPLPRMIWPTNYSKYAAATLFTLFFGGNDFAPLKKINGEPVQEFLQGHFIRAFQQLARRVKDLPNVVGYDTFNEPSPGLIGCHHLNEPHEMVCTALLRHGEMPTFLQGMALASGIPQKVGIWDLGWTGWKLVGQKWVNSQGISLWRDGFECVWKQHGVWDILPDGKPGLLKPQHFSTVSGKPVDFCRDYLKPFANRFGHELRTIDSKTIIFIEGVTDTHPPQWEDKDINNIAAASHWYDIVTLYNKRYRGWINLDFHSRRLILGKHHVRRLFERQLAEIRRGSMEYLRGAPTVIGEFGIPFDMNKKEAYRTANFWRQTKALDAYYQAMESNLLSCTLWNYTADNSNQWGDLWNDEDLSLFSRDQQVYPDDINSGGRALKAVVRPYAVRIAGEPLKMSFDLSQRVFLLEFKHDPAVDKPTEIFIPEMQYPDGANILVSDGTFSLDLLAQTLYYRHGMECGTHTIKIIPSN